MSTRPVWAGKPFPLGPEWDGEGTNFSLFSEHAERVELCLFDEHGNEERIELRERTAYNWHCYLPGVGPGQHYGYRVHGPYDPAARQALQPGEAADRPVREGDRRSGRLGGREHAALRAGLGRGRRRPDDRRRPTRRLRCRSASSSTRRSTGRTTTSCGRARRCNETVIYELHVKGFTALRAGVREDLRGTYGGLASPDAIELPDVARRDGGRAAAGAPHHRRELPRRSRPDELLGLLDDRLPRAALAVRGDAATRCASSRAWSRRCTAPASR